MSAPLGLGGLVRGYVDAERQKRDLRGAAQGAAALFDGLGTDNAKQYAEMLRTDPRGAFVLAEQVGGLKNLIAMEQANAARARIAQSTAGQSPNSPEFFSTLAEVAAQEGELGAAANLGQVSRSFAPEEAKAPTVREFKVGDRIVTRQFDPTTRQWVDIESGPRFRPQTEESIEVGPDGVTIRKGGRAVLAEATRGANIDTLLSDIDDLEDLTDRSPGTVGDPATFGRIGGRVGHVATQFGFAGEGAAEAATRAGSGGASQEELAEADMLTQSVTIAAREALADKGNLNRDERRDLRLATGADAMTPTNRKATLRKLRAVGVTREIRRARRSGGSHPLDPETSPAAFIDYFRKRGYSDDEIDKIADRVEVFE